MKPIYILCLHNVRTGGPEAIHQLSDALIEQGFDARLIYYTWPEIASLERAEPQDGYLFQLRANAFEEYARYKTNVVDAIPNQEGVIVVLPETLCHLAPKFAKATVLIWWLSVDNGFGALSKVNLNHLRRPDVYHAWQSDYAGRFIEALGIHYHGKLTDYTVDLTEYARPLPWAERLPLILFNANPHKVTRALPSLFDEIARVDPRYSCQQFSNIPRASVAELFARAMAYVDLGSFPGNDRAPREALSMGCKAIVSIGGAAGECAAAVFVDQYMNDKHLAHAVLMAVNDGPIKPSVHLVAERDAFFDEVQVLFADL